MARLTSLLADWADLYDNAPTAPPDRQALADALLRACQPLDDGVLSGLPASPDDAAAGLLNAPFDGGVYLPYGWLESFCSGVRLPLAEIDQGWSVSDGEEVYLCFRADLADDPDAPDETRPFVRVDRISRWSER
jgi:hypothetical protein